MNKQIYILLLLIAVLTGCYRDDLCFDHPHGAQIELKIDWSRSKLYPNAATALIYKDSVLYRTEVFSTHPPVRKIVDLPIGKYNILVFDEQESDYKAYLSFENKTRWHTFELRTIDDYLANLYSRAPLDAPYKSEVDTIAVDRQLNFEVTQAMINHVHVDPTPLDSATLNNHVAATLNFLPRRAFTIADIVLKVTNGKGYYFTQRNPPYLEGTSESYFPGIDKYSIHPVSHAVKFTEVPYRFDTDASANTMYVSTLQVIGLADYSNPDIPVGSFDYFLTLNFTYSGGIISKRINVRKEATKFIYRAEDPNDPLHNWDHLYIELDIDLPPLKEMGGFDAEVEDWIEVDIPLDGPTWNHFHANNGSKEYYRMPNRQGATFLFQPPPFTPVDGLLFKEWNTHPDGSGIAYLPGDEYTMLRGGSLFYACWDKVLLPEQNIYFHANNGTTINDIVSRQRAGTLIVMPTSSFSLPVGRQFKEWNTQPDATGVAYKPGNTFRVPQQEVHFYAVYE